MSDLDGTASAREGEVAGVPLFWREAAPAAGEARAPVLYLHGVPTDGDDFLPFLARTGGLAPDLPGFGRSGKPAEFAYSIEGYASFLAAFLADRGVERFSLVVHDWGGVGLALAQADPGRIERLVVMNCVPLLPGYRWHAIARVWRTRGLGELAMGFSTRGLLERLLRPGFAAGPPPRSLVERIWAGFDHGTQRAILRLYRSAPSEVLARAGAGLGELRCPGLVVWGEGDPFVPASLAGAYAEALGGPARVEVVQRAGHWPWLERPEVVDAVADFLLGEEGR